MNTRLLMTLAACAGVTAMFALAGAAQAEPDPTLPAKAAAAAPVDAPEGMLGTTSGEAIYTRICQGCHMPDGKGAVGAGAYPAFAGNQKIASSRYMALTILQGRGNMPAFQHTPGGFGLGAWLTDVQIANVINHVRTHFGNHYNDAISAEEVKSLRQ
ncbi:hypothetical protein BH11PSE14_BH11PSE14_19490 [soil metagenome]